ncbi:MAG TPA: diguanylate cyclase [Longimicrobium sp.]|nr:diguanylate cyclase [Longimicrobium sp.]
MTAVPATLRDPLTHAHARASFHALAQAEVARARGQSEPLAMLVIDLDHFKSINDAFGHARGDAVLAEFAVRLREVVRASDLLVRYGGDEFVLLLPGCPPALAGSLATRLLDQVRGTTFAGDPPISVSLSIGVASFPEDAGSAESLFAQADRRLYLAKRSGRGTVVSEDSARATEFIATAEESRPIEQDTAREALQRFLVLLAAHKRGIFGVGGKPGSGRSRFLREAATAAALRGCAVFRVQGRAGLRPRMHGALLEAGEEMARLVGMARGEQGPALAGMLERNGKTGAILLVDDFELLDPDSVEFLRDLLSTADLPVLGVVVVADDERPWSLIDIEVPLQAAAVLQPLTVEGLRSWVRSGLRWEAPDLFLRWLHRETAGLPARVERGLAYLVEQRVLREAEGGWAVAGELDRIPLAGEIESRRRTPAGNVPSVSLTMVGRTRELRAIRQGLAAGSLLTLFGPGGIGKTRLAIQVALEEGESYPDGAFFVALAPIRSGDLVASAIAEALRAAPAGEDSARSLVDFLREKRLLLVLDNAEHVVEEAAELVSRILEAARGVKIVVTSRERLNVREERIVELSGMPVPEGTHPRAAQYASLRLLVERARRHNAGFQLDAEGIPHAVRICRSVGGLPLAIELAAALVRVLPLAEVADEVQRSLDALETSMRDVPARHRSLRGVFEYSWSLLAQRERASLRALSVFRGGFRREAAERVADASLPVLASLVDKSLLRRTPSGRYEVHEVLRVFAAEKLAADPAERTQRRDLHAAFYTDFLHLREARLRGVGESEALAAISEDIANVRHGWRWALGRGRTAPLGAAAEALFQFYSVRGWYREGERVFRQSAHTLDAHPALAARLRVRSAYFAYLLGDLRVARRRVTRALPALEAEGLEAEAAFGYVVMAIAARQQGQLRRARRLVEEALARFRSAGSEVGEAWGLNETGVVALGLGEFDDAERSFRRSYEIRSALCDRVGTTRTLINLGIVADHRGDREETRRCFLECLRVAREIGDRSNVALALHNLGVFTRGAAEAEENPGMYHEAKRLLRESLALYRQIGSRSRIASTLSNLGDVALGMEQPDSAAGHYRAALEVAREIGAEPLVLASLTGLCEVALVGGDADRAAELIRLVMAHPAPPETRARADRLCRRLEELDPGALTRAEVGIGLEAGVALLMDGYANERGG